MKKVSTQIAAIMLITSIGLTTARAGITDNPGVPLLIPNSMCGYPTPPNDVELRNGGVGGTPQLDPDGIGWGSSEHHWQCYEEGGRFYDSQGESQTDWMPIPIGTDVTFRKLDLQLAQSGVGPTATYPRTLTSAEWDFDGDDVIDFRSTGPFSHVYWTDTTTRWLYPDGSVGPAPIRRGTLLAATYSFDTLGKYDAQVQVTYSDGSSASVTGKIEVVPDRVEASIKLSRSIATTTDEVRINADESYALSGAFNSFEWDLDGNGTYETNSALVPYVDHIFHQSGINTVGLRVTSRGRSTDVTTSTIEIRPNPPIGEVGVSINDGSSFTNSKEVTLHLVWPRLAKQVRISNDGGFAQSRTQVFDLNETIPWSLDNSVVGIYTKMVYVRFIGGRADSTRTFSDDIILDSKAPNLQSVELANVESSDGAVQVTESRLRGLLALLSPQPALLRIVATDRLSGVNRVQLRSKLSSRKILTMKYKRERLTTFVGSSLWIRVLDRAGNGTKWSLVTRKN